MRSRSFFLRTTLITLLAVASVPASAWAEPTKAQKTEAAKLKKEADGLMGQDRYVDALALYQKAYTISSDPALLYNQGRALEAMGEYPDAVDKLEQFDKDASPALHAKVPALKELINDLKGRIATLVVTTNAPGARLLVRDKAQGVIDGEKKVRTRAGPATIEVSADGYNSFKNDVTLTAGATVRVDAQLQLKKSDAVIVVHAKPNADILLDGKPMGRVPLEFHAPSGRHTVVAQSDGYDDESVPMTLSLGDRRELDIELHKSPGITSRWYFWGGIGLVAAVAVGIGVYAVVTTERSPNGGSFGGGNVVHPQVFRF
jgi:hypothetical protein